MRREMSIALPFMTAYDPPGTSEGSLDPLGLYQIADQLAVMLVPAVRERMQRIRFLTAMAVGAMVTEGLEDDPEQRDASPYLVWEWLVVEAIVRAVRAGKLNVWGVPGTDVTNRALDTYGYVDARSYLKTARIFGFNGVYKRLAIHLGLVDVHLGPGPNAEGLVAAVLFADSARARRQTHDKPLGGPFNSGREAERSTLPGLLPMCRQRTCAGSLPSSGPVRAPARRSHTPQRLAGRISPQVRVLLCATQRPTRDGVLGGEW